MDEQMESEVLKIFAYDCVDKLKIEPKVIKNHQSEEVQAYDIQEEIITTKSTYKVPNIKVPIVGAKISCCLIHQS